MRGSFKSEDSGILAASVTSDFGADFALIAAGGAASDYAAIQQFGGQAGRGHKVTIPARPFLPVRLDGTLYPQEQALVLDALNAFLAEGL